jgi:hypothetical protein
MKLRAFWDIAPSSLGVDGHFRGVYCLHHEADEYAMNKGFTGYIGISQTNGEGGDGEVREWTTVKEREVTCTWRERG